MRPIKTDTKPWYKQFWPWFVIFFPTVAVVAGTSTIFIAIESDDGLIEDDYYKKGLLINVSKKLDKHADSLGLSGYIRINDKTGEGYILMDKDLPQASESTPLVLILKHATRADLDQSFIITQVKGREINVGNIKLTSGKWNIQLLQEDQWRLTGKIHYPKFFDSKLTPSVI